MGINTLTEKTKSDLIKLVNEALKQGLPITSMALLLENVTVEVRSNVNAVLQKEAELEKEEKETAASKKAARKKETKC